MNCHNGYDTMGLLNDPYRRLWWPVLPSGIRNVNGFIPERIEKETMELYQIYNPITAAPFACNENYMEFAPCDALKPYIRCFWGTKTPVKQRKTDIPTEGIVTPDTCMDITFDVDYTNNKINSGFCGIDDRAFSTCNGSDEEKLVSKYGIRFFAWSGVLFSEESMRGTRNGFFDAGCHFSGIKQEIEPHLFDIGNMREFIQIAEAVLLKRYCEKHENAIVSGAVAQILMHKGSLRMGELSKETHISSRQLERLFREYVGVSPKSLASLVRYQYLWNDILYASKFDVLDAVCKYGYTDQAHLNHEFKKFHSMSIAQAKRYAMKNVGNIQDIAPSV